jgi:hypothetical protein
MKAVGVLLMSLVSVTAQTNTITFTKVTHPPAANFPAAVLADNPVAYWRLNDAGNPATNKSCALDSTGTFNGVYESAVKNGFDHVVGPSYAGFETNNSAARFANGTAHSYVSVPPLNLNTNTVTITAWVYPIGSIDHPPPAVSSLVFCRPGDDACGLYADGSQLAYVWNQNATDTYRWNSGLVVPRQQWSFVALVVSPSNAILYLCNSSGQFSATNSIPHTSEAFNANTLIGGDSWDGGSGIRSFDGLIDEVAIFKSSLSAWQILDLFDSAIGRTVR